MKSVNKHPQRGLGLVGFILGALILTISSIAGLKLVPPYVQCNDVQGLFVQIANNPTLSKAPDRELKAEYSRLAKINDTTAINADDIVIEKEDGHLILSARYAVKVPLVKNVSFYIDFNPSSATN